MYLFSLQDTPLIYKFEEDNMGDKGILENQDKRYFE